MSVIASDRYKPEPVFGFDHVKAVQIIGYFLRRAAGPQDKMKLIKLVYLADRLSLRERGKPLNFDDYYSIKLGPVASTSLNGMNGAFQIKPWGQIALAGDNKTVVAVEEIDDDHLSPRDIKILDSIWEEFGALSAGQLSTWTHRNCPEYTEVTTGRVAIQFDEILSAVGSVDADDRARELKSMQVSLGRLTAACGA